MGRRGSGAHRRGAAMTGVLHVTRPGTATVTTSEGTFPVARGGVREGMNGDTVMLTLERRPGQGGPWARVQGVVERATSTFLGRFGEAGPLGAVVPLDERIARDFFVLPGDDCAARLGVQDGDVVSARILAYPSRQQAGVVTIDRRVGSAEEGVDINVEAVIASFDLATEFDPAVEQEVAGMSADVTEVLALEPLRRDLRDVPCVTIDPVDARDFDDAVSARRVDGGYEVGVHIADVTHYLAWGGHADIAARERTCSVYLVDRVLPMLPERLSNDLCSLRPHEDRLAMSVVMRLDRRGEVTSFDAFPSAIRSAARLDYDFVDELLLGEASANSIPCDKGLRPVVAEELALLDEVSRLRQRVRALRGAIDFDAEEAKVTLDADGHPTGVRVRSKTAATSLVEEAMLIANECVARLLAEDEVPSAYRVHESPSPDALAATIPVLRELGLLKGDLSERIVAGEPTAIQTVLDLSSGTPDAYLVSTLLLRAMKRAVYLPENGGHYALGAGAYCHFTSPIRRYPDDIVHRALKARLAGTLDSPEQREVRRLLPQLCRSCSERERVADAAERASQRVKMAELYLERVGERCHGVVVGVEHFGLFVRIPETCAEGLLRVRDLGEEYFVYDEERMTLVGEDSGDAWRLGRELDVIVEGCDPARGYIDFTRAADGDDTPRGGRPHQGAHA